jgi:hypothetical protein
LKFQCRPPFWIGLGSFQAVRVLLPMAERPSVRVYSGHDSQAI